MTDNAQRYQQLLEHVPCNLCGHDDFLVIYASNYGEARPDEIQDTFRSSGDEILLDQLVQCNHCGLQYLTPRLNSDVVIGGYSEGEDENFVSQAAGRERTFAQSLKLIEKYAPGKGRILDVGTAGGSFLAVAQRNGWDVEGCEPNRWMAEWGKAHYGIEIVPGTLFDMELTDETFDVITLWDVIEHTPDPTSVLEACHRLLKPGGLLVVNIPDIGSLVSRVMRRGWVFLLSIHLYYFTVPTLREMLAKTGFEMTLSRPHWQTLELGYILFRMEAYIRPLAKLGGSLVKAVRLQHMQIPYWMGQTLVIAEKGR